MNETEARIAPIQGLGYLAEEATFLSLVAGQSGYLVARQFDAPVQVKHGKRIHHRLSQTRAPPETDACIGANTCYDISLLEIRESL
jgi:hypothetical protein